MHLARIYTRAQQGIDAPLVTVETHLSAGMPKFTIVGLPEAAVRESKERVRSAIINSLFRFPDGRITVNLAPADLPKSGGRYDLAIAIGILAASNQLLKQSHDESKNKHQPQYSFNDYEFAGELTLSGELRPVTGALPWAIATQKSNRSLIISDLNANEASLVDDCLVLPANNLLAVCAHLTTEQKISPQPLVQKPPAKPATPDFCDVIGHTSAKRALEIAAAGKHNVLFIGPPGAGKTLLSQCLPGILPDLNTQEALEVAAVRSLISTKFDLSNWCARPFYAPHHTASKVALVGGGNPPAPGIISYAHHGVLFLDELPEFRRDTLESLREPIESGCITIARAGHHQQFPANFQLITAMNPCPCGLYGDKESLCRCTPIQIQRYQRKISGPLLDRIDLHLALHHRHTHPSTMGEIETSAAVKERTQTAFQRQIQRQSIPNSQLSASQLTTICPLSKPGQTLMATTANKLKLSMRSQHRIIRVARTIADLQQSNNIAENHVAEAIHYRQPLAEFF